MASVAAIDGVLADLVGVEDVAVGALARPAAPGDRGVLAGRVAVTASAPHGELAGVPFAVDEDLDVGVVGGGIDDLLGHGSVVRRLGQPPRVAATRGCNLPRWLLDRDCSRRRDPLV